MNPSAMMAAVAGVMGLAIFLLFKAYTGQVELRVTAELAAASSKAEVQYQADLDRAEQTFHDKLNEERQTNEKDRNSHIAEINKYRQLAEKLSRTDPISFGDDYHVRLARIMCRIEAGTDLYKVETCNSAATETFLTDIAFTLTVTAENAEVWREQCEDGNREFCDWSLTGMTPQAALTLLSWLEGVTGYAKEQGDHINALHGVIDYLGEPEPPDKAIK